MFQINSLYLGVDVAGKNNTWLAGVRSMSGTLTVDLLPRMETLQNIQQLCELENVVAVAIDAQLSLAISDENGFRGSDEQLRSLLPADCRNWVASINSLMAVPVRGQLLAGALRPTVGTILETHPRADLLFALGSRAETWIKTYKKGKQTRPLIQSIWELWSERFSIQWEGVPETDGALDALVCATVAYLYHHQPEQLLKLRNTSEGTMGYGPFYVIRPERDKME